MPMTDSDFNGASPILVGSVVPVKHRFAVATGCSARLSWHCWISVGDWLGTDRIAQRNRNFRPFFEARAFARSLKLQSAADWRALSASGALPPDIPAHPWRIYRDDGWVSFGDWLGTGRIAARLKAYRSFEDARTFVRSLKLKSETDWQAYCACGKLPSDIPLAPQHTYREDGWTGMRDWLGTDTKPKRKLATR
jgi:hypothetical protein